ncbi:MAG: right-handed parallel beta-helix repeat-containing protein [Planctomycetota bacterium]
MKLLSALSVSLLLGSFCGSVIAQPVTRASVDSNGLEANGSSEEAAISAAGRVVAFSSRASNLVPDDTNGRRDVFLHDLGTGQTVRVSVSSSGEQSMGDAESPSLSADGRYVAFTCWGRNLVDGDTNSTADIFVHDVVTGSTVRVSISSLGEQGMAPSTSPSISADGRFVTFSSMAPQLVPGDTNKAVDIFLHDRDPDGNGVFDEGNGTTVRVSVDSEGNEANAESERPQISADGRWVVFSSMASNLTDDDVNSWADVFIHDTRLGTTRRVSVGANAGSTSPSLSADGRYVAFSSSATNLVPNDTNDQWDVFVRDLLTGRTERVSLSSRGEEGNYGSAWPRISADGLMVVFSSWATNLVPGDRNGEADVFLRDRRTGQTTRVSCSASGAEADGSSHRPAISANGTSVLFESDATDLVPGDTNQSRDIFVTCILAFPRGAGVGRITYRTIQEAIDRAQAGATVIVSPGSYFEMINFRGKAITLRSSHGAEQTIIDAQGSGTVVTFNSGEGPDTVLDGFTITGGAGTTVQGDGAGGGIYCEGASPTIKNNRIVDNFAKADAKDEFGMHTARGGGIFCRHGSPLISGNVISGNISGNLKEESAALGGGIHCEDSTPLIVDNIITDNVVRGYWKLYGGGISCVDSTPTIARNVISRNVNQTFRGALYGGGIALSRSSGSIADNAVASNRAGFGGGLYLVDSSPAVIHNTLTGNTANNGPGAGDGGGIYCENAYPAVSGAICWDNRSNGAPEIFDPAGGATVTYSDIQGGWPGQGNLDADPSFVDPSRDDYRLRDDSPCRDAGDPSWQPSGKDVAGSPRLIDANLDRIMVTDMGAFEFANVHLTVTGLAVPGCTVAFEVVGKPRLLVFLFTGVKPGEWFLAPFGALFFDPDSPWGALFLALIPDSGTSRTEISVPPDFPVVPYLLFQVLGLDPAAGAGNVSNPVEQDLIG